MSGKLNTHVLDTVGGRPASGMRIELHRLSSPDRSPVADILTNADGRSSIPLLAGESMIAGTYELLFHVGDYFSRIGSADARRFLDVVPLRFIIEDPEKNYHVPLLVTPWSYSTYRGS
jgi:5-hydroxyisourate hydrolase